jgi:hypothetical protein
MNEKHKFLDTGKKEKLKYFKEKTGSILKKNHI